MDLNVWLAYVTTAIIFSLSPGSGTVNSITNGLSFGWQKSLSAVAGLQLGLAIHIVLVGVGIGALVAQSAVLFTWIKWIGVVYLIWLGVQKWRAPAQLMGHASHIGVSALILVRRATLINLTNPKSIVFLVALFPQFIDPSRPQIVQFLILGGTTVFIDTGVMMFYTFMASKLKSWVQSEHIMRRLNRIFGSAFLMCSVLLATAKA